MISADIRGYDFFTFGEKNNYGQPTLSPEVKGCIYIAINTLTQNIADNILYKDATYVGLTQDYIDDTYVIQNGVEKLKVLYIQPKGRYKQVFLKVM